MKKIYSTLLLACMSLTAFAQAQNDTTYVMLDFNQNIWNHPVGTVTKGWAPDYKDHDADGALLGETDFSWPLAEGSSEKVKVTFYIDLDEIQQDRVSYYASYDLDEADAATLYVPAGNTKMLYTQTGASMRFKAPDGYQFGKMVFHNFHNANFLVGDDYEEEYPYEYKGEPFKHKLKVWTPASPKKNQYDYNIWEGDAKNILFNYPYFSAVFVKIDIRLVPEDVSGIKEVNTQTLDILHQPSYTLDGRRIANGQQPTAKGLYIIDGKKHIVK
jgi:hypothetical protein